MKTLWFYKIVCSKMSLEFIVTLKLHKCTKSILVGIGIFFSFVIAKHLSIYWHLPIDLFASSAPLLHLPQKVPWTRYLYLLYLLIAWHIEPNIEPWELSWIGANHVNNRKHLFLIENVGLIERFFSTTKSLENKENAVRYLKTTFSVKSL